MIELILLGFFVGTLSGFFGIGGGTILVPILLLLGYDTKIAINISIIQMVFSSIYGSYLNNKKGTLDIAIIAVIGLGGFIGALFSSSISSNLDDFTLELIFLFFAIFALIKMFFQISSDKQVPNVNRSVLFIIGFILGILSMTIGVGGSILLVPILVSFFHFELKKAISAGLFFVVFSSVSGLISHSLGGYMDFRSGIIIGLSSLFGVYLGIILKDKVSSLVQKNMLVGFYLLVVIYLGSRIF
jgi:uncharacterized membrane protein YfcA